MVNRVELDSALFRAEIGEVTPLAEQNRIAPPKPSTQARVRSKSSQHTLADTLSDFYSEESPDEFQRSGLSRQSLRRLRRGLYPIQDNLDLHGHSIDASRQLLQGFLFDAVRQQLRCVLVIHGKGMNSPGGEAVLRTLTRNWLTQHPQVLAFCAASPGAGGSGAVLILLKISA